MAESLPELLPGLVEAVKTVAQLELPDPSDIFYKQLSSAASSQVQQLLRTARSSLTRPTPSTTRSLIASATLNTASNTQSDSDGDDDEPDGSLFTNLTAVLDDTLERLDVALDASQAATEQFKLGGWAAPAGSRQPYRAAAAAGSAVAGSAARFSRVQRHIANLPRPQDAFPDAADNSNRPWHPSSHAHLTPRLAAAARTKADPLAAHAAQLAAAAADSSSSTAVDKAPHPYAAELASLHYQPWQLQSPQQPLVPAADFDAALAAMVAQLQGQRQIALDVEHHSYRSFQGFACLLQVSSRAADWVVDCLALRSQLGPALAPLLADPAVEKVLHGADSDVLWLQRDFGLYLVNMFDSGQAARVLCYPSASLAHLLERHCGFKPDKRYQLADWRLRPLPADMLHYARADTHFLLAAADALRCELGAAAGRVPQGLAVDVPPHSGAGQDALGVVLERSRLISAATYQKPLLSETSYLDAAARWGLSLPPANLAVFGALFAWRDSTARALDESVQYVMPKAALLELSRAAPQGAAEVRRLLGSGSGLAGGSGLLLERAEEVAGAVRAGLQQAPAARSAAAVAAAVAGAGSNAATADDQQQGAAAAAAAQQPAVVPPARPGIGCKEEEHCSRGCDKVAANSTAGAQRSGEQPPEQQQQPEQASAAEAAGMQQQQQQQQQQPDASQQQQESEQAAALVLQQQQPEIADGAPAAAAAAAVSAPKQLAAPRSKPGSCMAGLLSAKPRRQQQQQRQQAAKLAALTAKLSLPFMAALGVAAEQGSDRQAAATGYAAQQQQQQQLQQQQDEDAAPAAAAVSGAEVRAAVDQMLAEAADEEQQEQAAAAGHGDEAGNSSSSKDEKGQQPAAAGRKRGSASSGWADLEYVSLSAQRAGAAAGSINGRQAKKQRTAAAAEEQQQQVEQEHKRKRGIFESFEGSGSDDGDGSSDEGGEAGHSNRAMPAYDPNALKAAGARREWERQQAEAAAAAEDEEQQPQGRGRGRGGVGVEAGVAAGAAGMTEGAGGAGAAGAAPSVSGGGCGANPFAIPDSHLMKGGKRSSVVPRGGNRSASFK
ncbi:hypothetical protein COO60DRAFT_1705427 [Scenedesmus sp. NREL 46B-D3]|nr:hypothetical protein COO60DRAFT_1705427 [Scenedesmus sp. NREL 46B-D3]